MLRDDRLLVGLSSESSKHRLTGPLWGHQDDLSKFEMVFGCQCVNLQYTQDSEAFCFSPASGLCGTQPPKALTWA